MAEKNRKPKEHRQQTARPEKPKQPRDELIPADCGVDCADAVVLTVDDPRRPANTNHHLDRHALTVHTGININNRNGTSDEIRMR
jgi:hypothetical protein